MCHSNEAYWTCCRGAYFINFRPCYPHWVLKHKCDVTVLLAVISGECKACEAKREQELETDEGEIGEMGYPEKEKTD